MIERPAQGLRGHTWRVNDYDGLVDVFGLEYGFHNGPVCESCGYSYCMHCDDGPQQDCTRPVLEGEFAAAAPKSRALGHDGDD